MSTISLADRAIRSRAIKIIDIYCRISVDYDGTLRSVESQEEDCRDAIADHDDWMVGEVFRDHAKSGWNPKVVRKDFERLMDRLVSGQSDGIMVYDLTRFTRKPKEGERLLELAARGIVVASITTQYNLQTADGRKQFRDAMTAAAYESDKISERSTRGKRKKARRGKSNASHRGYGRPGYLPTEKGCPKSCAEEHEHVKGWEPGDPRQAVPAEQLAAEQAIIREMASRILNGESLWSLARDLGERGIVTLNEKPWNGEMIRQLLEAPSLAGLVEHNGEIIEGAHLTEGDYPLDEDTWHALQAHFGARRRGRPATSYLLSGIIYCGRCGGRLYGRPQPSGHPYPDGEMRRTYACMRRSPGLNEGCARLVIDQRYADEVVRAAVIRHLSDPAHASQISRQAQAAQSARGEISARIKRLETDAIAIAGKMGEWGFERVEAATKSIDEQLVKARRELDAIEGSDAEVIAPEDVAATWAEAEESGDLAELRRMVKRAFPRLVILPATSRGRGARTPERFDLAGQRWADQPLPRFWEISPEEG